MAAFRVDWLLGWETPIGGSSNTKVSYEVKVVKGHERQVSLVEPQSMRTITEGILRPLSEAGLCEGVF